MKNVTRQVLESSRPGEPALDCINFVLEQLYEDDSKTLGEIVAGACTYEELIGSLLAAQDILQQMNSENE